MIKKGILGIELTDDAVRVVSLKCKHGQYIVEYAVEGHLDEGAVVNRRIIDIESVAETLKKLLKHYGIKHKKVAMAVESNNVISKVVTFDEALQDRDIENQLEFDADKYIPESSDEVCLDFLSLGASKTKGKQDVLIVVTHKEPVDISTEVIESAGLSLEVMDVYHYVLLRLCHSIRFSQEFVYDNESSVALIDLGARRSQLTIICRDEVVLRESYRFSKTVYDNKGMEEIIPWFKRQIQIFTSNHKSSDIVGVFLYGKNAQLSGVSTLFELITKKTVRVVDPFMDMEKSNTSKVDSASSKYFVATGLALRQVTT